MPAVPQGWITKFLAFQKCQCCSQLYYLFFRADHPQLPVLGGVAFFSRRDAFRAIDELKRGGQLTEQEHAFFGREIAASELPEEIVRREAVSLSRKHENSPVSFQGFLATVMMLSHEPKDSV